MNGVIVSPARPAPAIELAADLARPFESLRKKAYHDPVGYPTQAYGRLLSRAPWADLSQWPDVDEATAERWLAEDLARAFRSVRRLCPVPLTPEQEAALIDFTFNCGAGNLELSTLRRRINRQDFEGAASEFGRWVYARGVKLPGLVRRRAAERALFMGALLQSPARKAA